MAIEQDDYHKEEVTRCRTEQRGKYRPTGGERSAFVILQRRRKGVPAGGRGGFSIVRRRRRSGCQSRQALAIKRVPVLIEAAMRHCRPNALVVGAGRVNIAVASSPQARQSVPLLRFVACSDPPDRTDARAVSAGVAQRRGTAVQTRDRHMP